MKIPFLVSILFMFSEVFSEIEYKEEFPVLRTNAGDIFGTLYVPEPYKRLPVAILVAGSGPTDRNGNQPKLKNNSLKMLAEALGSNGIASLRYDKRAIGQSKIKNLVEEDLRFEHYIEDAKAWSNLLKDKNQFNQIIMVGHSEGSLIGIIASQTGIVDKFISLAGPGKSADKLLKEQLSKKPMVSYFASPNSFTGEDIIEINCHGGSFVSYNIISSLCDAKLARFALPGEFTFRSYYNGKIDLIQAESINDLINCETNVFANKSIENLTGRLSNEIKSIKTDALSLLSGLEYELDLSENEIRKI